VLSFHCLQPRTASDCLSRVQGGGPATVPATRVPPRRTHRERHTKWNVAAAADGAESVRTEEGAGAWAWAAGRDAAGEEKVAVLELIAT